MPVGASSAGLPFVIFSNSGSVTTSSATPNLRTSSLFGSTYGIVPVCEAVDLVLNVTANTGTNQSLIGAWIEMQTSWDGGTTWVTFWRSAQITSSTTVAVTHMRTNGIGANETAVSTTGVNTATASITQNCVITQDQRVVWTLSTANANSPAITFGLYAITQTAGSRASY